MRVYQFRHIRWRSQSSGRTLRHRLDDTMRRVSKERLQTLLE